MSSSSPSASPAAIRRVVLVSQKVVDIKAADSDPLLSENVGVLFDYLVELKLAVTEKVTGSLTPIRIIPESGEVIVRLAGSALMPKTSRLNQLFGDSDTRQPLEPHIDITLPLKLVNYNGSMDIQSIFRAVQNTAVSDGGNVQNMAMDIALMASGLKCAYPALFNPSVFQVTLASTSDPFEKMPPEFGARLAEFIHWHRIDMPDRFAIQLPCNKGKQNRMSITSEPARSPRALQKLIESDPAFAEAFRNMSCIVTADPIFLELARYAQPPYACIINSSTAFRPLVAAEAYGRTVILCQNKKEAQDVLRLLMVRLTQKELGDTEGLPFTSPVNSTGDGIDGAHLAALDNALYQFKKANPVYEHPESLSFDYPITFDADGGLIIGAGKSHFAVFTTILSEVGERSLLDEFADPATTMRDRKNEVGAGDVVASCVALWNTVDPSEIVKSKMRGDQSRFAELVELSGTIFVSVLSRVLGNLLVRTQETHLSNISPEKFAALADAVAAEAVRLADRTWKDLHKPAFGVIDRWGIKAVIWHPGQVPSDGA